MHLPVFTSSSLCNTVNWNTITYSLPWELLMALYRSNSSFQRSPLRQFFLETGNCVSENMSPSGISIGLDILLCSWNPFCFLLISMDYMEGLFPSNLILIRVEKRIKWVGRVRLAIPTSLPWRIALGQLVCFFCSPYVLEKCCRRAHWGWDL